MVFADGDGSGDDFVCGKDGGGLCPFWADEQCQIGFTRLFYAAVQSGGQKTLRCCNGIICHFLNFLMKKRMLF